MWTSVSPWLENAKRSHAQDTERAAEQLAAAGRSHAQQTHRAAIEFAAAAMVKDELAVGPGRYYSPYHRMPCDLIIEGFKRVR
jgi:hypothetical protein